MAVKVVDKETGKVATGKYAVLKQGDVHLYSGIRANKKGGFGGCGKKLVFSVDAVAVNADDPAMEMSGF